MKKIQTNKGSIGDLGLIILVIIVLFLLWYFVGGGSVKENKPFFETQNGQAIPSEVVN